MAAIPAKVRRPIAAPLPTHGQSSAARAQARSMSAGFLVASAAGLEPSPAKQVLGAVGGTLCVAPLHSSRSVWVVSSSFVETGGAPGLRSCGQRYLSHRQWHRHRSAVVLRPLVSGGAAA